MNFTSDKNIKILLKRRDYLLEKINNRKSKNMIISYEEEESEAISHILNEIIELRKIHFSDRNHIEICSSENRKSFNECSSSIIDSVPKAYDNIELYCLQRTPTSKITISLEIKGDEKSISFKMFYRQNEEEIWKQGQKVKIYPSEIP